MSLRAGDIVEHFVIVSPLGEGGMGKVYLARDTRLQRSIALKIMQPDSATDAGGSGASNGAARLLREAQAAAGLEHPNVVTIYEVGEVGGDGEEAGRPFIAMELVKGKALRALIGDASVTMRERIRWLVDAARALGAAHRANLIHRDIKPENIMVRDDGVVKVLDFGLAKRATTGSGGLSSSTEAQVLPSLTGKGVAIGTPYYMAPEQMRRETLDGRADQFAWGVVAYELLSGAPAWGRDIDALELVSKLLSEDPRPLGEVSPAVPAHVAAAVMRAISKRRVARFDTMEQLVHALEDTSGVFAPTLPGVPLSQRKEESISLTSGPVPAISERNRTTVSVRPPPVWKPLPWVVAGALAVAAIATGIALYTRGGPSSEAKSVAPNPAVDAAPASAPAADAFPDFGSPMSKNVEATAAYRKGMRAFRDADAEGALREMDRAIKLDPDFAAAHLRRGVWRIPFGHAERDQTREAVLLRDGLGPHDRVLLDAVAPLLDVPENFPEAARRLADAFTRAPGDTDFAMTLCRARQATRAFKEARDVCTRARDLDPNAAAPILEVALVQARLDDVPGALASFDACLRASPLAASCLEPLWQLQTFEGRCAEALTTARRLVSINPGSVDAYDHLATALAGVGEPIESVRLALTQKGEHVDPGDAKATLLRDAAMVAIYEGDFTGADKQLRAWEEIEAASHFEWDHEAVSYARIQLAEEQGKQKEAAALATAHLRQRPAWTLGTDVEDTMYFVGELYALGAIPRAELVAKRTQWIAGEKARSSSRSFPWIDAYATPARTESDAREALDALPSFPPLPDALNATPEYEGPIGKVYRLAGRDGDAIPFLSHAAHACAQLASPFEETAASLDLGLALERTGQSAAACEAYRVVLHRWGGARTSLTAATAKQHAAAMHCDP